MSYSFFTLGDDGSYVPTRYARSAWSDGLLNGPAVVAAGADAITAVNTMPGMLINAYAAKPVLSNRFGGISGRALKPIALRCVAEIRQVVNVPIIGTGGVTTGVDAAEMLMAGATAVGVGTAVWERGPEVFGLINSELASFMAQEGYENLASLQGKALH